MNDRQDQAPHSTEAIWNRVNEQQKSIGEIQANVASLAQRVEGGFAAVMSAIERVDKPPDTLRTASFVLTLLVVLGSIGLLVVVPMQDQQNNIEQRQWEAERERAYMRGYLEAERELQ